MPLPVVLLTSAGWNHDSADHAFFAAYLTKPIRRARLQRSLQTLVGRLADAPQIESKDFAEVSDDSALGPGRGRVLVVDDNVVNQRLSRRLIEKLGYQADLASNGAEAVAALKRRDYQLVFMDCQMPVMDGFDATRQIRGLDLGRRRIPIIAMTANAMSGDREHCIEAGMDDYIAKPVRFDELKVKVGYWDSPGIDSSNQALLQSREL